MSDTFYDDGRTSLTKYCGPVRDDGGVRIRFQITGDNDDGRRMWVTLSAEESVQLGNQLAARASAALQLSPA